MPRKTASLLLPSLAAALIALCAGPALAGPPYLTDDPEPTDVGHWEIYNFAGGMRGGGGLDGEAGLDLNYGAAKDLQLTASLPVAFDNARGFSATGLRGAAGDVELAAKYRFIHQAQGGWTPDVSVFPRLFAPTAGRGFGTGRASLLLPVWAQKDLGPWSVFGGGGYTFNPGTGQRDFWQGGIGITRAVTPRLSLGAEVFGQARDTVQGGGFQAVDIGATYKLTDHWSLLASGGPMREQDGGRGQVFYLALEAQY
jgi:hypothetical protein